MNTPPSETNAPASVALGTSQAARQMLRDALETPQQHAKTDADLRDYLGQSEDTGPLSDYMPPGLLSITDMPHRATFTFPPSLSGGRIDESQSVEPEVFIYEDIDGVREEFTMDTINDLCARLSNRGARGFTKLGRWLHDLPLPSVELEPVVHGAPDETPREKSWLSHTIDYPTTPIVLPPRDALVAAQIGAICTRAFNDLGAAFVRAFGSTLEILSTLPLPERTLWAEYNEDPTPDGESEDERATRVSTALFIISYLAKSSSPLRQKNAALAATCKPASYWVRRANELHRPGFRALAARGGSLPTAPGATTAKDAGIRFQKWQMAHDRSRELIKRVLDLHDTIARTGRASGATEQ